MSETRNVPQAPSWTWQEIACALDTLPDQVLLLAARVDVTNADGCKSARLRISDHVRRELVKRLDKPKP